MEHGRDRVSNCWPPSKGVGSPEFSEHSQDSGWGFSATYRYHIAPTISAAGTCIPPLFIFKGVRVNPSLLQGAPAGSVMAFTETGYMRDNVFRQYLEHFVKSITLVRPVLLMMDGHTSHIGRDSIKFCHEK